MTWFRRGLIWQHCLRNLPLGGSTNNTCRQLFSNGTTFFNVLFLNGGHANGRCVCLESKMLTCFYHNSSQLEDSVTNRANLMREKPSFRNVWNCQWPAFYLVFCRSSVVLFLVKWEQATVLYLLPYSSSMQPVVHPSRGLTVAVRPLPHTCFVSTAMFVCFLWGDLWALGSDNLTLKSRQLHCWISHI